MRTNLEDVFRKPYWRETDARVAIEAWKSSGLSVREFCRRTGIDSGRIRRWAATLDGKSSRVPNGPFAFHPVRVIDRPVRGLEIRLTLDGGRSVSIPGGLRPRVSVPPARRNRGARVIALPSSVQIFVAAEAVDVRRGFDGLAALTRSVVNRDPMC